MNPQDLTRRISEQIADSHWHDLTPAVCAHSLRTFINFAGCAVGGSRHDAIERAVQALASGGDVGFSPILGRSRRVTPHASALLNGISASVYAFDDTHAEAMVHSGSIIGAALVGINSSLPKVDGTQFMLSYTWGVELMCRLSKAISVAPAEGEIGWSQSGVTGAVGAAAACGKLLRLDARELTEAIGMAATLSSGLRVGHGTMAMHLVPAQAAATGLQSALLVRAGFTGPGNALEGRHGFLSLFSSAPNPSSLLDGLCDRFEILLNTFKAYPCGIVIHGVIDACLRLQSEHGIHAGDIKSIELNVPADTALLANRQHPASEFEAQVSAQHWAAAALLHGTAGIAQGTQEVIDNPSVRELRNRCSMKQRPGMAADAAEVCIGLIDGRSLVCHVDHFRGSLARPLDDDALGEKFLAQALPVLGREGAIELLGKCRGILTAEDVGSIWTPCDPD